MPAPKESKHDAFIRLMERRMSRALEELRLVSQLSSINYENTPEEAELVIEALDASVRSIATAFDVSYVTRIGKRATSGPVGAPTLSPMGRPGFTGLDGVGIAKALDLLRAGDADAAQSFLRNALMGRAA